MPTKKAVKKKAVKTITRRKTMSKTKTIESKEWEQANYIRGMFKRGVVNRVLLHGQTRTGKSTFAANIAQDLGLPFFKVVFTPDTSMAEVRGFHTPVTDEHGNAVMRWMDGPAIAAWRHGGLLLIDEIDRGGADLQSFCYVLFDDPDVAALTLPREIRMKDGELRCETIKPHPNFRCVVTTNRQPGELEQAVQDRFPLHLVINEPNPMMFESLPKWLRPIAYGSSAVTDVSRRISPQKWVDFGRIANNGDVDKSDRSKLFDLIFGDKAKEVRRMMRAENETDAKKLVG